MNRPTLRAVTLAAVLAATLASLVATDATAAKRLRSETMFAESALRRVQVPGGQLAYLTRGVGEPVVLLHPTGLDMRAWEWQIESLSRRFQVIAYSRRFHYPNAPAASDASETIDLHVRDLAALIRALHLGEVRLIGHSEGAAIAAQFAFEHPELVRSLVLADPSLPGLLKGTSSDSAFVTDRRQALTLSAMALRDGFNDLGVERWIDWEYGDGEILELPRPVIRQLAQNVGLLRHRMARPAVASSMSCSELAKIGTPMLVVDGARSPWYARAMCDSLASCRPQTRRVTMKGAAHGMTWSRPNDFNKTVTEFMATAPVAGKDD